MVAMRDGVRLATDIYRPARGGAEGEWYAFAFEALDGYDTI